MSNDWRNHWRKSRWVTIADFPLLSLDINPATYEGGHADAGCRGNDLLKQAFASDDERIGIKLRMRTQPGNPQHKARHLLRLACRPGEYQPDEMDREVFLQDAIAFAVSEGWEVPDWLHALSPVSSHSDANELAQAKARIAELEMEVMRLQSTAVNTLTARTEQSGQKQFDAEVSPELVWYRHKSRLFKLLPDVIRMGNDSHSWPKQEAFIVELANKFQLSAAEAKALDAITRPDELRGKKHLPRG